MATFSKWLETISAFPAVVLEELLGMVKRVEKDEKQILTEETIDEEEL